MDEQSAKAATKREEVFLEWVSPARLFKKREREFFVNLGVIIFTVCVIFVFAREILLVLALLSLFFLIYVLSTVPPEDVKHKITSLGIESAGHFYRWEDLADFWFEEQWGQTMLVVRPYLTTRTIILLGVQPKEKIRKIVAEYIPFREEPQKTWVDNAGKWLSEKIPLEKPQT